MSENKKSVETRGEQEVRTEWQRPELRRIEAGQAEGAAGGGTDNVVFS